MRPSILGVTPLGASQDLPVIDHLAYRRDVEGLRGLAVLLVVAFHARIVGVSGGYVGVDVFFVLSGYLITGLLTREMDRTGRIEMRAFYARRVLRLLPAAALVIAATLIAQVLLLGPMERIEASLSALAAALYSSNLYFMARAMDYFAAGTDTDAMLHMWSLAVEEQFYIVWPVLILVGMRVARSRRGFVLAMGAFTLASLVGCIWLTAKRQPWAFFGTPARAWEFGIGGLASLISASAVERLRPAGPALGWAGLAMIISGAVILGPDTEFPGIAALLPVLGTTIALVGGAAGLGNAGRIIAAPVLQWLGKRSYSWYLWHWPVIVLATSGGYAETWPARVAWMVVALALATVTTAFVENPIRFHPQLRARPVRSLLLGAGLTLFSATFAFGAYRTATAKGGDLLEATTRRSPLVRDNCITDFAETRPRECVFGDTASRVTVVLLGDSHAMSWFPALDPLARREGWRLVTLVKYACAAARVTIHSRIFNRAYTECDTWREAALRRVAQLSPAAVIVAHASRAAVKPANAAGVRDSLTESDWHDGTRSLLQTLDSLRIRTVVFRDSPRQAASVPECLSRARHRNAPASDCGRSRDIALSERNFAVERDAARGFTGVSFLDVSDEICTPSRCEAVRDGIVVYSDATHLTERFAAHLVEPIARQLVPLLARPPGPP